MFGFFKSKKEEKPNTKNKMSAEDRKLLAQQDEILAGLQDLNRVIGASAAADDARMRNAEALIKEGSGR